MGSDFIESSDPTKVSLILNAILKQLDFETLKKCRLVCKLWEYETTNKLLCIKTSPVTLTKDFDCSPDGFGFNSARCNHITIPTDLNPHLSEILLSNIVSSHGRQIKSLEIQNSGWTYSKIVKLFESFERLETLTFSGDFILPKTPSCHDNMKFKTLKSLTTLQVNLKDEHLQNLVNLEFLQQLFLHAPNLQNVQCWSNPFSNISSLQTTIFSKVLLRSIAHFHVDLKLGKQLSHLDINVDLRNQDLELLRKAKLPLKTLHIPIDSMVTSDVLDDLLSSLQKSLKRLKLTHKNCNRPAPTLETVTNLEVIAIHGSSHDTTADIPRGNSNANPNYLRGQLDVLNIVPIRMFPVALNSVPLTSLKEIQFLRVPYSPMDVNSFKFLFPNLRKIKASNLSDDTLRVIFRDCVSLKVLDAPEGLYSDAGITGISPLVQDIACNGVTNDLTCADDLRAFHSLVSLANLRVLKLSSAHITDFGVVNGLAQCTWIQELVLDLPNITDASLKKIARNLKNLDSLRVLSGSFSVDAIRDIQACCASSSFSVNAAKLSPK